GPRLRDATGHGLELVPVGGVSWTRDEVTGGAMSFDGTGHLRIAAADAGALDAASAGDRVSVMALVRRDSTTTGFIAGMWQEHDDDPRRQYGLFTSLPTYGGDQQVCGHVSADGRPSDELPYSRDYAASERVVPIGSWHVVGFTYDGESIVAWLDGIADKRPRYTEPEYPLGAGLTYAKNPYRYAGGLNRLTKSDFTVGGVMLTSGMGNMFVGRIARLAVFAEALDERAVVRLQRSWIRWSSGRLLGAPR
ncbi:MAG: hypothetical protein ABWY03_02585, partial [Microbacterium sp.]